MVYVFYLVFPHCPFRPLGDLHQRVHLSFGGSPESCEPMMRISGIHWVLVQCFLFPGLTVLKSEVGFFDYLPGIPLPGPDYGAACGVKCSSG